MAIDEQLRFLVRLVRLENILPPFPTVNDSLSAAFFNVPVDALAQIRGSLADEVDAAARALLADNDIAAEVDQLPFETTSVIVGLGDSLTADAQSWFEVLARAYRLRKPESSASFINAGVSGETTTQMLARLPFVAAAKPTHVLCLAGANDARRFGSVNAAVQVSLNETERNLVLMRRAIPKVRWFTIVPPATLPERMAASPFWASTQTFWDETDLEAVREIVRRLDSDAIDLRESLGLPPLPELFLNDGLHLSLSGNARVARRVIQKLARTR